MTIRPHGDRVHLEPVLVRKSGQIDLLDKRAGVFWRVIAVGRGTYADSIKAGAIVAIRFDAMDFLHLEDGTRLMHASDVWCMIDGGTVIPVGPRVAIECEDPDERMTDGGLILLQHDYDFPTDGVIMGQRCVFNNKSHQLRFGFGGKLWVVGDADETFVGWL